MKKLHSSILLAGIFIVISMGFLSAQQMPGDPHAFYGEAKYSDGSSIDGLEIIANVSGNSFNDTIESGEYDLSVESRSGGTVEFYINGTKVGSHKFEAFESTNKDFNTNLKNSGSSGNGGNNNNDSSDNDSGSNSDKDNSGEDGGGSSDDDSSGDNEDDGGAIQISSDSSSSNSNSETGGNRNQKSNEEVYLADNATTKKEDGQSLFGITGASIGQNVSTLNFLVLALGLVFLVIGLILIIKKSSIKNEN